MKTKLYNMKGEEAGEVTLPAEIFEIELNADLVHQVAVSQMANRRQVSAHTKNRGEVSGGGRKPWAQKGTGKARVGSSRSPIWRGGGITFGPRNDKIYERTIPKKMNRKALLMVLSQKAKNNMVMVMDEVKLAAPKTKDMAKALKNMPCANHSTLFAMPQMDKNMMLSTRNIAKMDVDDARNLNVLDLLNHQYVLLTQETIKTIEKTFVK
jgi:large subunit ribosomal protein L4